MDLSAINWLAVFVSSLVFIALGAVWYGMFFRKAWLRGIGISSEGLDRDYLVKVTMSSLIMGLVVATGMAVLLESYWMSEETDLMTGLSMGVLCGIFFLFPSISMSYILAMRPVSLVLVDAFFYLISYTAIGAIVGGWR